MYGLSVTSCLSSGLSEPGGAGLGTLGLHPGLAEQMGEQAGSRRDGRGDARDHAPDEGARAHADRERGQCPGCEVGAAQAGYLRASRLFRPSWSIGWWYRRT
jgi:hypothetical protein